MFSLISFCLLIFSLVYVILYILYSVFCIHNAISFLRGLCYPFPRLWFHLVRSVFESFFDQRGDGHDALLQPLSFFGGEAELEVGVGAASCEERSAVSDPDILLSRLFGDARSTYAVRQAEPVGESAACGVDGDGVGHMLGEERCRLVAACAVDAVDVAAVLRPDAVAEVEVEGTLGEACRRYVGLLFDSDDACTLPFRHDEEAESEPWHEHLGEALAVDDALVTVECFERRHFLVGVVEFADLVVF